MCVREGPALWLLVRNLLVPQRAWPAILMSSCPKENCLFMCLSCVYISVFLLSESNVFVKPQSKVSFSDRHTRVVFSSWISVIDPKVIMLLPIHVISSVTPGKYQVCWPSLLPSDDLSLSAHTAVLQARFYQIKAKTGSIEIGLIADIQREVPGG